MSYMLVMGNEARQIGDRQMTIESLNAFIAETEAAMTAQERTEWFALSKIERMAAAWSAFIAIKGGAA
jgi:hypothetical protein